MPNQKVNSKAIDQAETRISTLHGIDIDIDFGNGLTIRSLADEIQTLRKDINTYNANCTSLELAYASIRQREQKIAEWCIRLLDGVGCLFGRKSKEYKAVKSITLNARSRSTPAAPSTGNPVPPPIENPVTPETNRKPEDMKAS